MEEEKEKVVEKRVYSDEEKEKLKDGVLATLDIVLDKYFDGEPAFVLIGCKTVENKIDAFDLSGFKGYTILSSPLVQCALTIAGASSLTPKDQRKVLVQVFEAAKTQILFGLGQDVIMDLSEEKFGEIKKIKAENSVNETTVI